MGDVVIGAAVLWCAAAQLGAAAEAPPRFVPSVGLTLGAHAERLSVAEQTETRGLLTSGVQVGLHYRLFEGALDAATIEGASALGVSTVFARGQFPVVLSQALRLHRQWGWFGVFGGLGLGVAINASDPTYSFISVELPLGARLGPVDVVYAPRVTLPLASESRAVFGGTRRQAVAAQVAPFMLQVQYRFEGLRF